MTKLTWDQIGDRTFQTGLDRGVLYLSDGTPVPWNGLTGLDEAPTREAQPYYQDGVKTLDHHVLGEFSGTLRAFTYPDEFELYVGARSKGKGLFFHDQPPKSFGLSYRTRLGNDVDGVDHGYVIHMLYNLRAIPAGVTHSAIGSSMAPEEFAWALSSTPEFFAGYRPTAHVSIKSTDLSPALLGIVEEVLYGTDLANGYLPTLGELVDVIETPLIITDNGDGTWSASGSDRVVTKLSETSFQISGLDVVVVDNDTYQIQTTNG